MKMQTLGWVFGAAVLTSSASIVACSQSTTQCSAGNADSASFAVKYYGKTTPAPACAVPGDIIGFGTYHPAGGGDDKLQPDFSVPAGVAFQMESMGTLVADEEGGGATDPTATHKPYSLGVFATLEPDTNGFCAVNTPSVAEKSYAAVPDDPATPDADESLPAASLKAEWSNVKIYVTAAAQGTQFSGHLKQTKDACVAEYDVAGVWPAIPCGKDSEDGKSTVVDPVQCCPTADPNGGRPTGSGINPDFPLKCDPDLFLCVLDIKDPSELPALNPTWAADAEGVPTGICKLTAPPSTSTGM
jgi:hypothetical protein